MTEEDAFYEAYVKTDEYALVGMYLSRVDRIGHEYRTLCRAWYNGMLDKRSLLVFYAFADEFFHFAEENVKDHLSKEDYAGLKKAFSELADGSPPRKGIKQAREIYRCLQRFAWKSGLTKLKGSRPKGKFGKIYAELGLPRGAEAKQ